MAITTINENDYIKDSRTVINDNFTELNTTKAPLNSPELTGTPTAPTPNPGDDSTKLATTEYVQEEIRTHASLPVGFEYFSPNPNIPQGSLPLFGGEYSRTTYSDLWAWVQEQTGYLKTESDWQDLSTAHNGNVPYYSDGDGSTTFRVPSLKCWVKAANGTVTEVGSYLEAGLPNITGALYYITANGVGSDSGKSLYWSATSSSKASTSTSGTNGANISIDASRSSSIYGNSTTVQPESIVGMWLVKAYGTIVDTGTIDEQQYIDDRIATCLPLTGGTMLGTIKNNGVLALSNAAGDSRLVIGGGVPTVVGDSVTYDGAAISLAGKDYSGGAGVFAFRADDGTNSKLLIGSPNGTLTWDGSAVVTKKDGNISSSVSISVTSGNATVTGKYVHKVGNVVNAQFTIKTSAAVNVGGTITCSVSGMPSQLITYVQSSTYYGSSAILGSLTGSAMNFRVIGANLASGAEFAVSFMYATVS